MLGRTFVLEDPGWGSYAQLAEDAPHPMGFVFHLPGAFHLPNRFSSDSVLESCRASQRSVWASSSHGAMTNDLNKAILVRQGTTVKAFQGWRALARALCRGCVIDAGNLPATALVKKSDPLMELCSSCCLFLCELKQTAVTGPEQDRWLLEIRSQHRWLRFWLLVFRGFWF